MNKKEMQIIAEAVKSMQLIQYMLAFNCYSVKAVNRLMAARYMLQAVCDYHGINTTEDAQKYLDDMTLWADHIKSVKKKSAVDVRK